MKYLKLFEDYTQEAPSKGKTIEDTKHYSITQFTVPYGSGIIFLYLNWMKEGKWLRVDFDKRNMASEGLSQNQMEMFQAFKEIITQFAEEKKVRVIYFQAKGTRVNIYIQLAKVLGEEYASMHLHTHLFKDGKDWFFLFKKEIDTPQLRTEIQQIWKKTIEFRVENGIR